MTEQKFITGGQLMAVGVDAHGLMWLVKKGLVDGPIGENGAKRTQKTDPCFYCNRVQELPFQPILCQYAHRMVCQISTKEKLSDRVRNALFPFESLGQLRDALEQPIEAEIQEQAPTLLPLRPSKIEAKDSISTVEYAQSVRKKYPAKHENSKRIALLLEKFPELTASECGALARRGTGPSDDSADADAKWYHRNKPK